MAMDCNVFSNALTMSANGVSFGFSRASRLLRVEYASGPISVRKIGRFSICNCEIGFLSTLACFLHNIICHKEHFHSFHVGTKSLSLRAELADTTKQSNSRHFDSTCSNGYRQNTDPLLTPIPTPLLIPLLIPYKNQWEKEIQRCQGLSMRPIQVHQ